MQPDNSTEDGGEKIPEDSPEASKNPDGDRFYTIVFGSITILSLVCLGATVLCISQYQRKQVRDVGEQDDKIEPVTSPNMIPMRRLEYNAQCMAVINGKLIDLRNTELKEVGILSYMNFFKTMFFRKSRKVDSVKFIVEKLKELISLLNSAPRLN